MINRKKPYEMPALTTKDLPFVVHKSDDIQPIAIYLKTPMPVEDRELAYSMVLERYS